MASLFNTSARLQNRTVLPANATREKADILFKNHDLLIKLDPELSHYEEITPPNPEGAENNTKYYKVTDILHTLPRGFWDTTVSFQAELTDVDCGINWVIRAPMGLVQTSTWRIEEAGEQDDVSSGEEKRLVIVEEAEIKGSRLLVGTVKSKCEQNWRGVHARWIEQLNQLP